MTSLLPMILAAAAAHSGTQAGTQLEVGFERLRNQRGTIHLCLTRETAHFPNCERDPNAVKRSVAATAASVRFDGIAPGAYALSVFHDENRNGKLDTLAGIPREGFGFSRNPTIRFSAPRFRQVVIDLGAGFARQTVRMQYLL